MAQKKDSPNVPCFRVLNSDHANVSKLSQNEKKQSLKTENKWKWKRLYYLLSWWPKRKEELLIILKHSILTAQRQGDVFQRKKKGQKHQTSFWAVKIGTDT